MILNRKCEKCGKDNHVLVRNKRSKKLKMWCLECNNMEYIIEDKKTCKNTTKEGTGMKIQQVTIELTEEEFRHVNQALIILRKMVDGLDKIGMESIELNETTWGKADIEEASLLLEDLEEECSIEH